MDPPHPLRSLLQLQLASDALSALHLNHILATISENNLQPSPHLQKWILRVNSLLQSKDPAGRWAGLCIAQRTAICSKAVMIESAQTWLSAAQPILSRNEPYVTVKASVRLLGCILTTATDVPEFQRQLVTPNAPKVSQALIDLAKKQSDIDLKILVLDTLTRLVHFHPSLHRHLHGNLSALSLSFLNGSANIPTNHGLLQAASRLYATLFFIGGKVGAANFWRKSLDETLTFSWDAFALCTSTISHGDHKHAGFHARAPLEDPMVSVHLHLDRLRCGIVILCDLLRSTTQRPVQVPIGNLVDIVSALLSCTEEDKGERFVDPTARAVQLSVLASVWELGCELLSGLVVCVRKHLTSSVSRLLSLIAYHLDQKLLPIQRLFFLRTLTTVLTYCPASHPTILYSRLGRAVLPSISVLVPQTGGNAPDISSAGRSKKAKKRVRGYEGDEVFKISRKTICPTREHGSVLIAALDAIELIQRNSCLNNNLQSIISRVLLSIALSLPQIPPASLSQDLSLYGLVTNKIQRLILESGSGTTNTMSRSLALVLKLGHLGENDAIGAGIHRISELLLHPRLPPMVRSMPHVESLALFRAEESKEEASIRESLDLAVPDLPVGTNQTIDAGSENLAIPPNPQSIMGGSKVEDPKPAQPVAIAPSSTAGAGEMSLAAPPKVTVRQHGLTQPGSSTSYLQPLSASAQHTTPSAPVKPLVPAKDSILPRDDDDEEDEEMPTINVESDSD